MTQMENRIVLARFKDGYGPVGAYFLHLRPYAELPGRGVRVQVVPRTAEDGRQGVSRSGSLAPDAPADPDLPAQPALINEVNAAAAHSHDHMRAFQDPHLEEVAGELPRHDRRPGGPVGRDRRGSQERESGADHVRAYVMGSHATGSVPGAPPEDLSLRVFLGLQPHDDDRRPVRRRRRGRRHAARLLVGSFTEAVSPRRPPASTSTTGRPKHRRVRCADQPPRGGDLQAPGTLQGLPQRDRGGRCQPALHQSQAGPGPPAEADGRVIAAE